MNLFISRNHQSVLQGYFLEISNLENIALEFALRITTSSISDPDRSLFGNVAILVDTPGTNNNPGSYNITGSLNSTSFGLNRRIVVPSKGTALVAILPSDPFPPELVTPSSANFECRGYVSLTLPLVFKFSKGQPFPVFSPQANTPQKVLITAQNRAIYTDEDGNAKGQSQSSIPLANGQAQMEIDPQKLFFPTEAESLVDMMIPANQTDLTFENMLAGMLSAASMSKMDLKIFNAALKDSGIKMAVEKRKS